jgi:RimJ/RimL family protein N-acetyltransferase
MEPGKVFTSFKSNKGNTVVIRYPVERDVVAMHQYINTLHAEDTYLTMLGGQPITFSQEKQFVENVLKAIKSDAARVFLITVEGKIIGVCDVWKEREPRLRHVGVLGIALLPEYREEGIGTQLMKFLISQGKDMGLRMIRLTCFANNPRALHLYEKLGFRKVGVLPGAILYQKRYIDQVIMYVPLV